MLIAVVVVDIIFVVVIVIVVRAPLFWVATFRTGYKIVIFRVILSGFQYRTPRRFRVNRTSCEFEPRLRRRHFVWPLNADTFAASRRCDTNTDGHSTRTCCDHKAERWQAETLKQHSHALSAYAKRIEYVSMAVS